eukprot:7784710-Pyramimonas_sp.AAC.1
MKVIKLYEDEGLTGELLPASLLALYRSQDPPDLGQYGAHSAQSTFLKQKANKFMVLLGPKVAELHP